MAEISTLLIVSIVVAVMFFGSNFVPLKSIQVTNYAFFQWVMCNAVLLAALPWALSRQDRAVIEPFAMIGGMSWCIGNFLCPYIIDRLGLGVGFLLWNTCEMLVAWLSSTCGILGVERQTVKLPVVNFVGIVAIILGGILLSRVDMHDEPAITSNGEKEDGDREEGRDTAGCTELAWDEEKTPLASHTRQQEATPPLVRREEAKTPLSARSIKEESKSPLSSRRDSNASLPAVEYNTPTKTIATNGSSPKHVEEECPLLLPGYLTSMQEGVLLAVIAGTFFGVALNPTQHLVDLSGHQLEASTMLFSHLAGVCYTSYFLFFLSVVVNGFKSNQGCNFSFDRQQTDSIIIGPAIFAGVLWGCAMIIWFVVDEVLPLSVTFPLFSAGPSIVSTMWSVFYFNEIKTTCDLRKMAISVLLMFVGLTCIWISDY